MPWTRPEKYRLQRVARRIWRGLDELSRAQGETRPAQFAGVREPLHDIITRLEALVGTVEAEAASGTSHAPPLGPRPTLGPRLPLGDDGDGGSDGPDVVAGRRA
jgi:hypothetical protein